MTRFARAKGSKASNEKTPEDSTPWEVMKEQLLQAKKEKEESKNRQEAEQQRIKNYENFLKEQKVQKRKATWCDFPETQAENSKSENTITKNKKGFADKSGPDQIVTNNVNGDIPPKKKKKNKNTSDSSQIHAEPNTDISKTEINSAEVGAPNSIKKKKKKKKRTSDSSQIHADPNSDISVTEINSAEVGAPNSIKKKIKNKNTSDASQIHAESISDISKTEINSAEMEAPNSIKKKKKKNKNKNTSVTSQIHAETNSDINKTEINSAELEAPNSIKKKKKKNKNKSSNNCNTQQQENKNEISEVEENQEKSHKKNKNNAASESAPTSNQQNASQPAEGIENKHNNAKPMKKKKDKKLVNEKPQRRKDVNDKSFQIIINGAEVELVRVDGFPVMKKHAECLNDLKKNMIQKGIPKSEIQRTMKLERRRAEKALARLRRQVCYNCRKGGHNLSDCPELKSKIPDTEVVGGICFKCGSTEHRQFECKVQRDKEFRFASCFICKESGHIARQCPDNARGLYPNGGCCKLCGDVTHLRKDCPTVMDKKEDKSIKLSTLGTVDDVEGISQQTSKVGSDEPTKKVKKITF